MEDRFGRLIKYLRISITDRCNLRCIYCMPPEGITSKPREEILRIEEILRVAEVALQLGINKFRLTGGEPLLRKGVIPFIKALALRPEVDDIAITTNGILLPQLAERLRDAGAKRLNISLDTLDEEKYRQITRGGNLKQVWAGIKKVLSLGFEPVKINTVALRGFNEGEVVDFARLTREYPLHGVQTNFINKNFQDRPGIIGSMIIHIDHLGYFLLHFFVLAYSCFHIFKVSVTGCTRHCHI
jgi:cyclic pyranopterin phosphate synthase